MITFEDLEDPLFKQLPPDEQYKGRSEVFRDLMKLDPGFAQLPLEERSKLLMGPSEPTKGPMREGLERGVEKVLGVAQAVGGAPEAATIEGMEEAYKHSREQLDQSLREIFGKAGEGVSDVIAKGRTAVGAGFSVFFPNFISEGLAPLLETVGKGYGEIVRLPGYIEPSWAKGLEPFAKVAESLSPDAVMILGFKAAHNVLGRNPTSATELKRATRDPKFVRELTDANNIEWARYAESDIGKLAAELDRLDQLRQSPEGAKLLREQLSRREAGGKVEAEFAKLREGALPEEPSAIREAIPRELQDIPLPEEAGVMVGERLGLPQPKIEMIRTALRKEAAKEKLTAQERQALKETSVEVKPKRAKEKLGPEAQRRLDEFEAKRRQIIDDARMILADPTAAEYTKAAALAKLDELGIKPFKRTAPVKTPSPEAPVAAGEAIRPEEGVRVGPPRLEPTEAGMQGVLAETPQRETPTGALRAKGKQAEGLTPLERATIPETQMELGAEAPQPQISLADAKRIAKQFPLIKGVTERNGVFEPQFDAWSAMNKAREVIAQREAFKKAVEEMPEPPPKGGARAPRPRLEDSEVAPSTYIRRNYVDNDGPGISVPRGLEEEFGAWNRWIKKGGTPIEDIAEEMVNVGILRVEPGEGPLDALIRYRAEKPAKAGSARFSERSLEKQTVAAAVEEKVVSLTETPADLEYKGKTYQGAEKVEEGIRLKDDPDKVLTKANDILSVEEKIPFEVPAEEVGAPSVSEVAAGREAVSPVSEMSLKDLIKKGLREETGAIGELTPEQRASAKAARDARREIYRRVQQYAKKTGKDIANAAEELGMDKAMAARLGQQSRERTPEVAYAQRQGTLITGTDQVKPGDIVYDRLLESYGWVKGVKGRDVLELAEGTDRWTAAVGNRLEAARRVGNLELIRKGLSDTGSTSVFGGELSPEQMKLEADARAMRKELYHRITEGAKQSGKDFIEQARDMGLSPSLATRLRITRGLDEAIDSLGSAATGLKRINEESAMILSEADRVMEEGTLSKELYAEMRQKFGPAPQTYARRISERGMDQGRILLKETETNVLKAVTDLEAYGDALSVTTARAARQTIQSVIKESEKQAMAFRKDLATWGRIGQALQRAPKQVYSEELIQGLQRLGIAIDTPRRVKMRLPIDTQIFNSIRTIIEEKSWNALTPEQKSQFERNLVDTFRLNLFSPTSFTLDTGFNLTEIGVQAVSGLGGDLVHAARGYPTFPSLNGIWKALQLRKNLFRESDPDVLAKLKSRWMVPEVEAGLGRTALGERIPGDLTLTESFTTMGKPGAFTERGNIYSAAYDAIKGSPMYAKSAVDTGVGRMAANMTLWREAFMEADRRGLSGIERQNFVEQWWKDLPQGAVDMAIEAGNKAKANMPLPKWVESFTRWKPTQLFVEAFGRWTAQFPRWAGEMMGYDPRLWKRFMEGKSSPEEVGRYLTRMATGIGGIWFVDQMMNNNPEGHVDYQSGEWVDKDKNRTRLSGLDTIIMPLFISQIARAGWKTAIGEDPTDEIAKITGLSKYVSILGLRFLYGGEGGVLGRITQQLQTGIKQQGKLDTRALTDGLTDTLNRMFPGQAILGTMKSIMDPVLREGLGANLPGLSWLKDERIDLATGEPVEPRQRYFGAEMPALMGTPIPGATRIMPEVSKMLGQYGLLFYRGPRLPIAGYRASEAPEEVTREWEIAFGKARSQIFRQVIPSIQAAEMQFPVAQRRQGTPFYEIVRKKLQTYDSMAARHATTIVNARHLARGRLPRQLTVRERRGSESEATE